MSFSSPDALSLAGLGSTGLGSTGLGSTGLAQINTADLPAGVRDGTPAAKAAYAEGLEFEQVLVNQLAQQLVNTVSSDPSSDASTDGSSDASSDGSDDASAAGSSGLLGAGSSASPYASLIPQALTSSIMSSGGLGIASEIAQAIDPSINDPSPTKAGKQ